MNESIRTAAISPLRQRLIDDMNMRRSSRETQRNYIRDVGRFATFLGRSPDTATADDVTPISDRTPRCRGADADHEQHRLGVAVLLHVHRRPARPGAQADPGG